MKFSNQDVGLMIFYGVVALMLIAMMLFYLSSKKK